MEVEYDKDESRLTKITKIDDDDELPAAPPLFSIVYFEIHTMSSSYNLGARDVNDPMTGIRARHQQEPEISFAGGEDSILKDFSDYLLAKDPDIIICSNQHSQSSTILAYLFARMNYPGLDLQPGRDTKTNKIEGRVYLSNKSFYSNLDLAGLIEKAFLPPSLAARYGMNRLVDSRNC